MQEVSEAWKNAHKQTLLPETFVEITMSVTDGSGDNVAGSSEGATTYFSESGFRLTKITELNPPLYYATLEENLWLLDGTRQILPESKPQKNVGLVSLNATIPFVLQISMREIIYTVTPGITIVWSSEYEEYPTRFTLEVRKGSDTIRTFDITGNKSNISSLEFELTGYDSILIRVLDWNMPNHRIRIDQVFLGLTVCFDKSDILSFTHEQTGDLLSATLPKNSISFSLDNSDGRWDLNNPTGLGRYLAERQKLTVRYGTDINGITEWIPGGVFYLSEWNTPANGLSADFVANDVFEFLRFVPKNTYAASNFGETIRLFLEYQTDIPNTPQVISNLSAPEGMWFFHETNRTLAEYIQLIANEYQCLIWCDRNGVLNITPLSEVYQEYPMSLDFAYSYPEITLSKPIKGVAIKGYESTDYENASVVDHTILTFDTDKGEIQVIDNPRLYKWPLDSEKATVMSAYIWWVRDVLFYRKKVSGEFRADPRLDLFDIVTVEGKYGLIRPVVITTIKYTYNGSFRGYYEGQVIAM